MSTAPPVIPLCRECKHRIPAGGLGTVDMAIWLSQCARTPEKTDPVTGATSHSFCSNERDRKDGCGPNGVNFEPDDCDVTP
jgi:hypothetical protein